MVNESTNPPDFTEQARQLLRGLFEVYGETDLLLQAQSHTAFALAEAATAALEQERRRIENALTKFGSGSLILYSNGGFELLAEGNAIRMNKKRCVAVGRSLTDLIAAIGDDKDEHGNRD